MGKIVLLNGQEVEKEFESSKVSVREACKLVCDAEEFLVPVLALLDGKPVLRKENGWENAIVEEKALLLFIKLPLGGGGGGGSGQMAFQAIIVAAAALATWYLGGSGGVIAASLTTAGMAATTAAAVGSVVAALAGAAIMLIGSLVSNALFGNKSQNLGAAEAAEAASPTYSVNASGNMARLNQAEGESFGLMKITPDYISNSYVEYSNNDQYAYFVYGLGRGDNVHGSYVVKEMYFGDTKFWDSTNGFISDSGFVSEDGEEFSHSYNVNLPVGGDWSGPYVAVASGAWAKTIRVEVRFPQGYGIKTVSTYQYEDVINGDAMTGMSTGTSVSWEDKTATILLQYAEIDDAGNIIGSWSSTKTFTAKNNTTRTWRSGYYNYAQDYSFSKSISFKASRHSRWAIRIKNGSAHIPHPQIQQYVPGQGYVWVNDPDATVYEEMRFANVASTALSIAYQFVETGQPVTLFPNNIVQSSEVSGFDLFAPNDENYPSQDNGWVGYHAVNPPGTEITQIKIDYGYTTGLGRYKQSGGLENYTVYLEAQAQKINDQDQDIGSPFYLGQWSDTAGTNTPQRKTRSFDVTKGRYKVRMRRTSNTNASDQTPSNDKASWLGLRGLLPGTYTYPQFALALKIKANNALSQQASQQFHVLTQRKLPVWNKNTKTWSEPQETRSWAAAVCAVCQEPWGGKMADRQIDLETLWTIDAELQQKGWYCDCYIDGMYSMWQLINEMCQMVLVVPRLTGSVLSFIQDKPGRPVSYELNARNIVRGSFNIVYNTWTSNSPDDVILNYLDADYGFQKRDVQATLPESESNESTTLDWIGITNREHAFRVATRYAAMNRWRRISVTCQVEALGQLLNIGDVVSVNHPRFRNTQSGVVVDWNASQKQLMLESDFVGEDGADNYISLTRPDGTAWGPVKVSSIADGVCTLDTTDYAAYLLQGGEAPFSWLRDGVNSQPTAYALHASNQFQRRMIVQSVSVDDLLHYSLTLVNDAPEVSQYDDLPVPPWNGRTQTNITLKAPQNVRVIWTSATGIASVTWRAVQGAIQYEVQHSANGIDWIHDGLTSNTSMPIMNESKMNWSGNASSDTIFVRVAALNNTQKSEWTEWPE